jgi:hypothetical protein
MRCHQGSQDGVADNILLRAAAEYGHAGTKFRSARFRRQGGGGIEKISGGADGFVVGLNHREWGSKFAPASTAVKVSSDSRMSAVKFKR